MRARTCTHQWNTNLRELSLSRNDLDVHGAQALARVVPCSLTGAGLAFRVLVPCSLQVWMLPTDVTPACG